MVIYKYKVHHNDQSFKMHAGASVLCVQIQDGTPCVWAACDPNAPTEYRRFKILATGEQIDEIPGKRLVYVGTWQDKPYVWHLFEVKEVQS